MLDGICAASGSGLDRVVAVDTGSATRASTCSTAALRLDVVTAPGSTLVPATPSTSALDARRRLRVGLAAARRRQPRPRRARGTARRVDRATPAPTILGPKLREWPSLRRLLELGVTISGTGRRETGLERGEYDQGQHDDVREVLAVNTAGMLVRRDGPGPARRVRPRSCRSSATTSTSAGAPRRPATARSSSRRPSSSTPRPRTAASGVRRSPAGTRTTRSAARRSTRCWPTRRPVAAVPGRPAGLRHLAPDDRLPADPPGRRGARRAGRAGLGLLQPARSAAARRSGATTSGANPARYAGCWRRGGCPTGTGSTSSATSLAAATNQAADVAERRRAAKPAESQGRSARRPPAASVEDEDDVAARTPGCVVRFFTNPVAVSSTLFVILALLAPATLRLASPAARCPRSRSREPTGGGWTRSPGTRSVRAPPPQRRRTCCRWRCSRPSSVGSPGAAIGVLVLAVPFSLWGAWRFLRVVGAARSTSVARPLLAWGAATYSLIPVVSGAWGEGRFGVVAVAALLPWLAHAALGFADPEPDRRWRAAWRCGSSLAHRRVRAPALSGSSRWSSRSWWWVPDSRSPPQPDARPLGVGPARGRGGRPAGAPAAGHPRCARPRRDGDLPRGRTPGLDPGSGRPAGGSLRRPRAPRCGSVSCWSFPPRSP